MSSYTLLDWQIRIPVRYRVRGNWTSLFAGMRKATLQTGQNPARWQIRFGQHGWCDVSLIAARRGMFWVWMSLRPSESMSRLHRTVSQSPTKFEATAWRMAMTQTQWRRLCVLTNVT